MDTDDENRAGAAKRQKRTNSADEGDGDGGSGSGRGNYTNPYAEADRIICARITEDIWPVGRPEKQNGHTNFTNKDSSKDGSCAATDSADTSKDDEKMSDIPSASAIQDEVEFVAKDNSSKSSDSDEESPSTSKVTTTSALPDSSSQKTSGDEATNPFQEFRLSTESANAVLLANINQTNNSTVDSDDEPEATETTVLEEEQEKDAATSNAEHAETEPQADAAGADAATAQPEPAANTETSPEAPGFNQRRIPRTRFYRHRHYNIPRTRSSSSSLDEGSDAVGVLNFNWPENDDEAEVDVDVRVAIDSPQSSQSMASDDSSLDSSDPEFEEGVPLRGFSSSQSSASEDEAENNRDQFENIDVEVTEAMCKSKPNYHWNLPQELMYREHNIINRIGWRGGHTSAHSFGQGYYGSRQVVERMVRTATLRHHKSCVNSLNFNRIGDLICSGSDDLKIVVWDWAKKRLRHSFKSGHNLNIFQTKFIDSAGCLDIVSSSRDGQIRRSVIPPSGGQPEPLLLYRHNSGVHKIVVVPHTRHEIMSAGEDSAVKHYDLRTGDSATTLLRCIGSRRRNTSRVRLFSIAHHPFAPEFCVSGNDDILRVYDKRKCDAPIQEMKPRGLSQNKITQITCAVYNHSGSEILASYSDAGIYLYDSRNYKPGEYAHSYEGHINSRTIKGVNFFGPRSEFVVSGSDCGHFFFWDKTGEAIVNYMKGDFSGVVNCLEPHPTMPVLATSGLDNNVKIWAPKGDTFTPDEVKLKQVLRQNFRRSAVDAVDLDIFQFHDFIRQFLEPDQTPESDRAPFSALIDAARNFTGRAGTDDSSGNSSSTTSAASQPSPSGNTSSNTSAGSAGANENSNHSSSSTTEAEREQEAQEALESLQCRTQ